MKKAVVRCSCQDPYSELPADLRPENSTKKNGLRKVTCPQCRQEYWTNRERDDCIRCEQGSATRD